MTTHMRPSLKREVSPSGFDYGHELRLQRVNQYGELSNGLIIGELSEADLLAIATAITDYLETLS